MNHADQQKKYSTTVLVEEIASLRKRIRELEDGGAPEQGGGGLKKFMPKTQKGSVKDSQNDPAYLSLKKRLADVTSGKAEMEVEYMNIIAKLENEKREAVEALEAQVKESDNAIAILKQRSHSSEENATLHQAEMDALRKKLERSAAAHQTEISRLQRELSLKDAQVEEKRKETEVMRGTLRDSEGQNTALSEEVTKLTQKLNHDSDLVLHLKAENARLTSEVANLGQNISMTDSEREEMAAEIGEMERVLVEEEQRNETLQEEIDQLKRKSENDMELVGELRARITELESERNDLFSIRKEMSSARDSSNVGENTNEIEVMRDFLVDRVGENDALKIEIKELKHKLSMETRKVEELKAKIEELSVERVFDDQKAFDACERQYKSQMDSLRSHNQALREEANTLKERLEGKSILVDELMAEVEGLKSQIESFKQSTSDAYESRASEAKIRYEAEIDALTSHNAALCGEAQEVKQKLEHESQLVEELKTEIKELTSERISYEQDTIDTYKNRVSKQKAHYETEINSLQSQNNTLMKEAKELKMDLERESKNVRDLKEEIKELTSERINYEQKTIGKVENRVSQNRKKYESEIDSLRVLLTSANVKNKQMEKEYMNRIAHLEASKMEVISELEEELRIQKAETSALQRTLATKEEEVKRAQKEMQQICGSMSLVSYTRRDEMEELQAELMEKSAANAAQAREIQLLKMNLEEFSQRHSHEISHLQSRLNEQQSKGKGMRAHLNEKELGDLRAENRSMREHIMSLTEERRVLREKVNELLSSKNSSRSVEVLRERNEALKKEVEKLVNRCRRMERSITRVAV